MSPEPEEQSRPQRPAIPADMRAFNEGLIKDFRATGGQMSGPMAGRSLMLLTTAGRRSGKPTTVVVGYVRDGERYVVIASNNGAKSHPSWYLNLLAQPIATVEVGDRKFDARASTAGPDQRPRLASLVPYLPQQQALTEREIPLVILEEATSR